jgi:hypothetical protein
MNLLLSAAQAETAVTGLAELLKFGILGIFCVLLIVAVVWVVKAWKAAMEERVADAKSYANGLKEVNDAGNKVSTEVRTTVSELERSHDALKTANSTEHGGLTTAVNNLREKQAELITEVRSAGKGNG